MAVGSQNAFSVQVLIPWFRLLDLYVEKMLSGGIKIRKFLTFIGNFTEIFILIYIYVRRGKLDRGLRSVLIAFECRIISARQHLLKSTPAEEKHRRLMLKNEVNNILPVGSELFRK